MLNFYIISYFIEYIASNILRGLNRRKVAKLARTEIFYQKSICICYKFVISSSKRIFRYRNQWCGSFPFETGSGSKFGSDLMFENKICSLNNFGHCFVLYLIHINLIRIRILDLHHINGSGSSSALKGTVSEFFKTSQSIRLSQRILNI